MLPDQTGCARCAVHIKKLKRLVRVYRNLLILGTVSILIIPVHSQDPAVFSVGDNQLAGIVLHILVCKNHIVCDRVYLTGFTEAKVVIFAGNCMC